MKKKHNSSQTVKEVQYVKAVVKAENFVQECIKKKKKIQI